MKDKNCLPAALLTAEEVIVDLRLNYGDFQTDKERRAASLRRLKYLRDTRKISFLRIGHKTHLYPRAGLERFKMQNIVSAI